MSSEDEDERRLQDVFIKTNVCWEVLWMIQKLHLIKLKSDTMKKGKLFQQILMERKQSVKREILLYYTILILLFNYYSIIDSC